MARPDKYCASHILFWGYGFKDLDFVEQNTKIYFNHNYVYNPKRIYFIAEYVYENVLFQKSDCLRSDFNHYYLNNDSFIYWDKYNYSRRNNFIEDYHNDNNSEFILLDKEDPIIVDKATNSLDYKELRKIFVDDVEDEEEEKEATETNDNKESNGKEKSNFNAVLISIIVIIIIVLFLIGGFFIYTHIKMKKNEPSLNNVGETPLVEM